MTQHKNLITRCILILILCLTITAPFNPLFMEFLPKVFSQVFNSGFGSKSYNESTYGGSDFEPTPTPLINHLINPGFEENLLGWEVTSESIATVSAQSPQSGEYNLTIGNAASESGSVSQEIANDLLVPGKKYKASGWFQKSETENGNGVFKATFLNESEEVISEELVTLDDSTLPIEGNPVNIELSFVFTVASNTATTKISIEKEAGTSLIYADDLKVVEVLPPTPTPTPTDIPPTPTETPIPPTSTPTPTPTPPDTTSPTVSITAPTNNGTVTRNKPYTITASATDNRGVIQVIFKIGTTTLCTDTATPYICVWNVPAPKNTNYTLSATASDLAGNTATHTISVTAK